MPVNRPSRPAGVALRATGTAIPDKVLTNDDLAKIVDTSDAWITQRTGIKTRHIVEPGTKTSDLAAQAVSEALTEAQIEPGELDLVLLATMTQDMICPATACQVAAKIGAVPCGAVDLNIACTGMVAGLNFAANTIDAGHARTVAVVAADTLSRIVDWEDRRTCVLFGDAASAAILTASDDSEQGCIYQSLHADGNQGMALFVPRCEADVPESEAQTFSGKFNTLHMDGKAVYKFAVKVLAESVERALDATGLTADDVKMVIPHQSNIRMLQSAWKRLGFDDEKVHINIDRFGNTSAASVGICLHELRQQNRVGAGDTVIFVAQGGGLSWGTSVWNL